MSQPETMMIDSVKYVREDSILDVQLQEGDFAPWHIGQEYYIETVTKYFLGKLVQVTDQELVIVEASWVADTGRFNEFLSGKKPKENEPYQKSDQVIIGRGAIVSSVKRGICIEVV